MAQKYSKMNTLSGVVKTGKINIKACAGYIEVLWDKIIIKKDLIKKSYDIEMVEKIYIEEDVYRKRLYLFDETIRHVNKFLVISF